MATTASTCRFDNGRGLELSARLERPTGTVRATAVFAHCFTCSKDLRAARQVSTTLAARGIAVLSFDFAGLGSSDGSFDESSFTCDVADLVAAAEYLGESLAPPSLLVGHSLGGAAVLVAATRIDSVKAVATIGAPADVGHVTELFADDLDTIDTEGAAEVVVAGRHFTIGRQFVEDLRSTDLLEAVAQLRIAKLFLHAPLDNTVGIDNAHRLYTAARHPRSFVGLDGADHLMTDPADARYAADIIATWAQRHLPDLPDLVDDSPLERADGDYGDQGARSMTTVPLQADIDSRGFRLRADEPASGGGGETGPTPYDYLAAGLASCTTMTIEMYARRKGWPLDAAHTEVTFDRVHADDCADCEHTSGRIERFTRTVHVEGDLDDEQRDRILEIANKCPVHRTLEGTIEVHTSLGTDA